MTVAANEMDAAFMAKARDAYRDGRVVLVPEPDYQKLMKAWRNAEYLMKLDRARAQIDAGQVVAVSMEELERMANG
ncbi:hypothetical protein FACS1894139_00090 [Planctomycetales bacterium]|nr:hypothetical protein FACS1894107_00960 [Planctomycetales bacterium]GHT01366.1 hypothetical protein FACS1894108_15020 [Planctomycetales bacterium]GHT02273.1 hypothetical protein FACS1894139_00090 [Planctomycetales bacterium]GHV18978.1 hypothetical protein AGMMS49959_02380 [Planctomycetales bacterium]